MAASPLSGWPRVTILRAPLFIDLTGCHHEAYFPTQCIKT